MLQNIRNNIQGTAAKVIIAIIIVPFALFGIDSLFNSSAPPPAAVVNGEKISEAELQQAISLQKRRLLNMMGDQIDPAMLDDATLRKPALNTLIKQQLLLQAANDENIDISDAQLNSAIVAMPQFQEDGRFSQERYQQVLRLQGYSSSFFKQLLKSDLTIQQLSVAVAGSSFISDAELSRSIGLLHESRDFHYIDVPLEAYSANVSVSDEEVKAFYEANQNYFLSDEKVRFSYIELTEQQFYKPVAEDQVQAEYQRLIDTSNAQIEREAAHILIEINADHSREEAIAALEEIRANIDAGASFGDQAEKFSDDAGSASSDGLLGFSSGDSFPPEFEEALASLKEGEVSPIVETEAGLHIIKLVSVRRPDVPSIDEARLEITEQLRELDARPRLVGAVDMLKDLVFNAENLTMPAKEMDLTVQQGDWLSKESDEGLFAYPLLKQAAFNEELRSQGLNSDVIELSSDHYVVIHVEEYKAPEPKPLESVRNEIASLLSDEKAEAAADATASEIKTSLLAGERAEDVAGAKGLEWNAIIDGKRSSINVDPSLRGEVFAMQRPTDQTSVSTVRKDNGDRVVVQLLDVRYGDASSLESNVVVDTQKNALRTKSSQEFSAYFNGLWKSAEIQIN
ncbi:Peptidyl-prolyl cis-trans isomerase D [Zhongshania aliphaticivorans]|uniref:Periplasmic chaperone PpiD n=1 Tax=Zhongshania aliphaticivorans TaxID=1470434 RepID=A0A5S9NHW0_9GAMM|nr:SurA N-terminal domain-containing protein [Zhongshania aliphaticivorans]CAA0089296.1 Peptidyl-prolyl cis-trans isomerase D [Zhongshania aliphaticivorans]CAA0095993.1 Peptidyl-prolyl cis-trans isomerase D [Zhongshania aliphaticivorans]